MKIFDGLELKYTIKTDDKIIKYSQTQKYTIASDININNKISIIKTDLIEVDKSRDYKNLYHISALVSLDRNFTYIHYIHNSQHKIESSQKEMIMNPKILELSKKIKLTKLIFDNSNKK